MSAFLCNDDPRPVFSGPCQDSAAIKTMLAILGHVETNYDKRGER